MHQSKSMIKNDQSYVSCNSEQMENKQPGNNPIVNSRLDKYIEMNSQTSILYTALEMNEYAA